MGTRCLLAAFVLCGITTTTSADVVTGPIFNPATGNQYYLLDQATWTASQAEAINLGGHLATINDAAENQWVYDTFRNFDGTSRNLWIGFTDMASEGTFSWISGQTPGYTAWRSGEPNQFQGNNEDFTNIIALGGGLWNDLPDIDIAANGTGTQHPMHGVVEIIIPEPTSLAWLLIAMSSLRRRPRM